MNAALAPSVFVKAAQSVGAGLAVSDLNNLTFGNSPSRPNQDEGIDMTKIVEPTPRIYRGVRNGNKARLGTDDLADWLADQLRNKAAKDIARDAGCGIRTAENVKQGRNVLSGKHLANLQLNDPDIAAAWCEYVGLLRPGEAETAAAYTKFANAAVRVPRP